MRKKFRYERVLTPKPYTKIKASKALAYFEDTAIRVKAETIDPTMYIITLTLYELRKMKKATKFWQRSLREDIDCFIWCFNSYDILLGSYSHSIDEMRAGTSGYSPAQINNFIDDCVLDTVGKVEEVGKELENFKLTKTTTKRGEVK